MKLPAQERLLAILHYDPETGALLWRERPARDPHTRSWNTRYAGKPALATMTGGYLEGRIAGKTYRAHRIIWKMQTGEEPRKIDHEDGVRHNNRWRNLRDVDDTTHARNCGRRNDNTSGATGITFNAATGKWRAQIGVNGRVLYLGEFRDKTAAIERRAAAQIEHDFHPNHGMRESFSPCA